MFLVIQAYLKFNTSMMLMRVKNWVIKDRKKNRKQLHLPLGFTNDCIFVEDPSPSSL